MAAFWSVAAAINWVRKPKNINVAVLDRMFFFCVHDEAANFVLVGEDCSKHIGQAVERTMLNEFDVVKYVK